MSLLGRLMGRKESSDYSDGILHYEEGDYAAAAPLLRKILEEQGAKAGSLVEFYLRQSLTLEGRRLLVSGDAVAAEPYFAEAAERWSRYPDLQFWYGLSLARDKRWPEALTAAQQALRFNSDYVEARLLEACALAQGGETELAGRSLDAMIDSGQRVDHPMIRYLSTEAPFAGGSMPGDLFQMLNDSVLEETGAADVLQAVETCRSGGWEEGIERMRTLCRNRPTYPDYRVKLAAALFQTGRNGEALDEVDQALVLNPRYRTAAHLKALILADQHRFADALEVIRIQDEVTDDVGSHPGEELFCSYLAATLNLLTGRFSEARTQLERWHDLGSTFPMAELLLAAVDTFQGYGNDARQRLEGLSSRWFIDETYQWYLACHLLEHDRLDRVQKILDSWPEAVDASDDLTRRSYLKALVALERGEELDLDSLPAAASDMPRWIWVRARSLAHQGRWFEALPLLRSLLQTGEPTESVVQLLQRSSLALNDDGDEPLIDVLPDSILIDRLSLLFRQERTAQAMAIVQHHRELHPEDLRWTWLDPTFWLEPVRRWIG